MARLRGKKEAEQLELWTGAAREKKDRKGLLGKIRREKPWLFRGIVVSLILSVVFSCFYGVFRSRAEKYEVSPLENAEHIAWLCQNCYLLYRDLRNAQSEVFLKYSDLYLETEEGYEWILDEKKVTEYQNLLSLFLDFSGLEEYMADEGELSREWMEEAISLEILSQEAIEAYVEEGLLEEDWLQEYESGGEIYNLNFSECESLAKDLAKMDDYFSLLEGAFRNLNSSYDYIIVDDKTGKYVTNMSVEDRNRSLDDQYFLLSFSFDGSGNVTIGDTIRGRDVSQVRKLANEAARDISLQNQLESYLTVFGRYGRVKGPVDCTVTFAVSREAWEARKESAEGIYVGKMDASGSSDIRYYSTYRYYDYSTDAYFSSGLNSIFLLCMAFMALLARVLPLPGHGRPWRDERLCKISLELLVCMGMALMACAGIVLHMIVYVASGKAGGAFSGYLGINEASAKILAMILNGAVLTLFFSACWHMGLCARALPGLGVREYIRQRSVVYRFFPFVKRKVVEFYDSMAHMDLTKNANRTIIKLLLVNAVILFLISCFWIGGFAITLVYSIVLYFILRKYISELQKRYQILLKAVDEIAEGKLNVTIQEDLGVFEPFREQVFKIQEGLQKAVDAEVKSQRMKVELVTNMSHDLKTPLTAIITYVNLLKEKDITEEQRREYLATLENRSLRLKSLIEDLFEFSKANSHNITLNIMDVDIMNLVKQVAFEMSDKIGAANLDVRMNLTDEKVILPLDSQKTYRIYENLFGNIAKYALPGTRVYVNGFRIDDTIVITLKNISAQEITVDSSELTERFVRGDASRNTEGSGLGLAIAKSFMELQGGQLYLEVEADLFKVTTTWYMKEQNAYPGTHSNSL